MPSYAIGRQQHLTTDGVSREISLIRDHGGTGIISDRAAATIASWWQAPSNPALTALSTAGMADGEAILVEINQEIAGTPLLRSAADFEGACLLQLKRWVNVSLGSRTGCASFTH